MVDRKRGLSSKNELEVGSEKYRTARVVYIDRRIWNYEDCDTGKVTTTVDLIKELLERPDITENDIEVLQPGFWQGKNVIPDEVTLYFRKIFEGKIPKPAAIVIPKSVKAETLSGTTTWQPLNSEAFTKLGEQLEIPVYKIGRGRIYPEQSQLPNEESQEYKPKSQPFINVVIKTEKGKALYSHMGSSLELYFPKGTFSREERLGAIVKTFPEWGLIDPRSIIDFPDNFHRKQAQALIDKGFAGVKLQLEEPWMKVNSKTSALWLATADGELNLMYPSHSFFYFPAYSNGSYELEETSFSGEDGETIALFSETLNEWDKLNEFGDKVDSNLNFFWGYMHSMKENQPIFFANVIKKFPEIVANLLGGEKISEIYVTNSSPMVVPIEKIPDFSFNMDGQSNMFEYSSVIQASESEILVRKFFMGGRGQAADEVQLTMGRKKIYPKGLNPNELRDEIAQLRFL